MTLNEDDLSKNNNSQNHLNNNHKGRLTVKISEELVEKAKNVVYWTRGKTLAQLIEQALEKEISSLEKKTAIFDDQTGDAIKAKGEPFPERKEDLKAGRPVK